MEVLVRCLRERLKAGDRQAAERIFERVLFRTQTSNQLWAAKVTQIAGRQQAAALAKELLQELNWALWQELESERQFIEEGFRAVLERLRQHVSHPYMQQEGLWTRKGVTKPERVPRPLMESLTPPDQDDGDATPTTVVQPADPKAEAAFDRVELAEELQELLAELTPEQRQLLFLYYVEDWTQVEIADHFGVTDRAIRDRLTKVLALLRTLAQQRGGPHD
jgi:RNA polymerase sigma factor (sigma-70 family)